MTRRSLLTVAAITAIAVPVFVRAQSKPAAQSFEVVSIKPNPRVPGNNVFSMTSNPAGVIYRQVTLSDCIQSAYGVDGVQVSGPSWITIDRYDILARTSNATANDLKQMLQGLLADRFKLVLHHETKDLNAHTLGMGKGDLKLKPVTTDGTSTSKTTGFGILLLENTSMADFVSFMARGRFFDGPIVDATGLKGKYEFTLMLIDPDNDTRPNPRAELSTGDQAFFAAIARLGLRMDAKKSPTDVLMVDQAEKPATN